MTIACLPSETAYDVQCPVCGRGFLFLTDPTEAVDSGALRRAASAALAAQHNRLKSQTDRRKSRERRCGMPDTRAVKVERRAADRRGSKDDRRGERGDRRGTEQERRTSAETFRRGSGAVHPNGIFYLQGWDGDSNLKAGAWTNGSLLHSTARC